MNASASQRKRNASARRSRIARPVRGFIIGVYCGGFVAWSIMALIIVTREGPGPSAPFIPFTLIVWIVYCTMIIVVFFFLPVLALKLGRKYPGWSRQIVLAIATLSSLAIWWCTLTYIFEVSLFGREWMLVKSSIVLSLVGGAVAGDIFWKHAFPSMEDVSRIFR